MPLRLAHVIVGSHECSVDSA